MVGATQYSYAAVHSSAHLADLVAEEAQGPQTHAATYLATNRSQLDTREEVAMPNSDQLHYMNDITVQYDKEGNLVTLGGIRQFVQQEVTRTLYILLHSEPEVNIETLTEQEFEAFCQRVLSEE